jgi:hypothetical protein
MIGGMRHVSRNAEKPFVRCSRVGAINPAPVSFNRRLADQYQVKGVSMKVKTKIKAGGISVNHNQAVVRTVK